MTMCFVALQLHFASVQVRPIPDSAFFGVWIIMTAVFTAIGHVHFLKIARVHTV